MEASFQIGDIADMFGISIRALRLYDSMGLFKPEFTDPKTGYRRYTADQIPLLNTILVLKAIGIRLYDIKTLVDKGLDPGDLVRLLQEKQGFWENQIEIARFNIENIGRIKDAALGKLKQREEKGEQPDAYKMSRLVCLENLKIDTYMSEALWL